MSRYLALFVLCCLPLQAAALSCMPWGVTNAYQRASQSEDAYVIVQGKLTFDQSKQPKVDWDNQHNVPARTEIPARLSGKSMSHAGFKTPFARDITLVINCAGPWCASAQSGSTYLTFLKKTGTSYELALNPCSAMGFANPNAQMLKAVRKCHSGGACMPQGF